MALKRIIKELDELKENPPVNFTLKPIDEKNLFEFHATINGPDYSPYCDHVFHLSLKLNGNYPFKPPDCRFLTKVYHPNVYPLNILCTNFLHCHWNPGYTL